MVTSEHRWRRNRRTVEHQEPVASLCYIAIEYGDTDLSLEALFRRVNPNLDDPSLVDSVRARLHDQPELIPAWQQYSYDKRATPSPFLDGTTTGLLAASDGKVAYRQLQTFDTPLDACAHFIVNEARWVLRHEYA